MKLSFKSEKTRMEQIRKLTDVGRALTYAATLDEVFELTVARAADLFAAVKALLLVVDDDGLLVLRSSHGVDAALAKSFGEPLSEGLAPRLASLLDVTPERFLGVPLVVAGEIKGILVVIRPATSTGAEQDEWLLSALADQAAVALEKSRLGEIGVFREQLIGIVGHDLRTPLNTILLGAHILLQHEGLGQKETEVARRISRSAQLAVRLIDQLLDLTQSRLGGGMPIDPKRVDMGAVCRHAVDESELAHTDRPVRVAMRGDLIGLWDRDRLCQLFANLLSNAVKHGELRSAIDVRIDGRETEVVIEITNRGEPIPPAAIPFIFDAFRKGRTIHPPGTQGLGPGLGLGLFIAQQIVLSHGGTIAATSSVSDGTTFRVRLPRSGAVAAAAGNGSIQPASVALY